MATAAALALALAGCAAPVAIVEPTAGSATNDPVTVYRVHFSANYRGGFRARLDGEDITAAFSPPPAPDGTSLARQGAFPAGSGVFERSGAPFWSHELFVAGDCRWYCAEKSTVADFTPPNLRFSRNDLRVRQGTTTTLRIEVERAPSRPLTIEIATGESGAGYAALVFIDGEPAGRSIAVTIPAGETGADFSLTAGRRLGRFIVTASAPGCQSGSIYGFITP